MIANGYNYTNSARISIHLQGTVAEGVRAELTSPNYPLPYPLNARTEWFISAPENHIVLLYINELNLEECCHHLSFWDGPYIHGSWLGSISGRDENLSQRVVHSTVNSMYLHLYSDLTITSASGFKVIAFAVHSNNSTVTPTTTPPTEHVCPDYNFLYAEPNQINYFESPNYPSNYFNELNCVWLIQTTWQDHVIQLNVVDVSIEPYYDHANMHDGNSTNSLLLGEFKYANEIFRSSNDALLLNFITDQSVTDRGFKVQYTAIPRNLTQEPATTTPIYNQTFPSFTAISTQPPLNATNPIPTVNFTTSAPGDACTYTLILFAFPFEYYHLDSPYFPNNYANNLNCTAVIKSPSAKHILEATSVDVKLSFGDYANLYDGNSTSSPLLGDLTNGVNENFQSTSDSLFINFVSDDSFTDRGFRVIYSAVCKNSTACSDEVLDAYPNHTSILESPNYPNGYFNNVYFSWLIQSLDDNYVVQIKSLDVMLESCCDHATLHDGNSASSQILGRLSNGVNEVFHSSSNAILLTFKTDYSITKRGFRVQYSAVLKNATQVPVTTTNPFHNHTIPESNSTVVPSTNPFPPVNTTGPISGDVCPDLSILIAIPNRIGYIETPNYPNNYYSNLHCSWLIQSNFSNYVVQVTAIDVYLESCCDWAILYDGSSTSSQSLGYLRNGENEAINSSSDVLLLKFDSDSSIQYRGFQVQYTAIPKNFTQEPVTTTTPPFFNQTLPSSNTTNNSTVLPPGDICPGLNVLHASPYQTFILVSPNYPNNYYNNLNCSWLIQTFTEGHVIQLRIVDVNLESCCDHAVVYDGGSISGLVLGEIQNGHYNITRSNSDLLLINFVTDFSVTMRGFKVEYTSVPKNMTHHPFTTTPPYYNQTIPQSPSNCSHTYHIYDGTGFVLSPNYPENYYNDANCTWLIQEHLDNYVVMIILQDMTISNGDVVTIYDGESFKVLYEFKHNSAPSSEPIYSENKSLLVSFVTDNEGVSKGFRFQYFGFYSPS